MRWRLHPRDKPGLLWAVLKHVDGLDARLSLEGYLGETTLLARTDADPNETIALKRQGYCGPPTDFVVLPVTTDLIHQLKVELNARGAFGHCGWLHHAQIEVQGTLIFGGYDNFHKQCVFAWGPLTERYLERLIQNGVVVSYEIDA